MSLAVETGRFNRETADLINRADEIFRFPEKPPGGSFQQFFSEQTSDETGYGAIWRVPDSRISLRIFATTREAAERVMPSSYELVASVSTPCTVLRLTVGSIADPKKAEAFFKRSNYPGIQNVEVRGRKAIVHATRYVEGLETAFAAGTLTFPHLT